MAVVIEVIEQTAPPVIEVAIPGIQGPSVLSVGVENNLTPGVPGMWIQTGLGPTGEDFTFWIEDGE